MRAPADAGQAGRVIAGRYRLLAAIGTGGMGTVWLAQDELLGRRVAVKEFTPPADVTEDESRIMRQRTLREARTAARLSHPNVVTIYDVAQDGGRPWIVMELLQARSLREIVQQDGPLTVQAAAEVGLHLLAALRAAHELGVVHRDVKPGNVLIGDGRTVLADFGIARALDSPSITSSGVLVGSPSFIAPERARGEPGGPASDLWSLGATLYAAVEGRPPYERDGALPTLTAVVTQEPDPPRRAGALWPVISGLLRRDPRQRLSADAAEAMLARLARAEDPAATAPFPVPAGPATPDRDEAGPAPPDRDEGGPGDSGALTRAEHTLTLHPAAPGPGSPPAPAQAAPAQAAPGPAAPAGDALLHGRPEPPEALMPAERAEATGDAEPAGQAGLAGDAGVAGGSEPPPGDAALAVDAELAGDAGLARGSEPPPGDAGPAGQARPAGEAVLATDAEPPGDAEPPTDAEPPGDAEPAGDAASLHGPALPQGAGTPTAPAAAPPTAIPPAGRPRLSRRAGLAVVAVVMVAAAATLFVINLPGTAAPPHGQGAGTPAGRPGTPQPGRSTAQQPGTGAAAGVPAGYHRYRDPTGFSIAVPDGWTVSQQGHLVYIRPPAGARFLLIDQTTHPKPDPLADWRQQEANRIGTYPGYHRIRLQAISYPQAERAADWEFTYRAPDGPTHVLNRNVLANAGHAYALYWSTPAGEWSRSLRIFRVFAATFRPAAP